MHYIKVIVNTNTLSETPNLLINAIEQQYLLNYSQAISSIIINGVEGHEVLADDILELTFNKWQITLCVTLVPFINEIKNFIKNFANNSDSNISIDLLEDYIDNTDYITQNQLETIIDLENIIIFNNLNNYQQYSGNKHKIYINASTAFGTGSHDTTLMCLQLIEYLHSQQYTPAHILDVGTGSGILSIACSKLFSCAKITATDIDPVAIQTAISFFKTNNVNINTVTTSGLENLNIPKQNLIISNILLEPLLNLENDFANTLAVGGYLILSGFTKPQKSILVEQYKNNFTIQKTLKSNDWVAVLIKKIE